MFVLCSVLCLTLSPLSHRFCLLKHLVSRKRPRMFRRSPLNGNVSEPVKPMMIKVRPKNAKDSVRVSVKDFYINSSKKTNRTKLIKKRGLRMESLLFLSGTKFLIGAEKQGKAKTSSKKNKCFSGLLSDRNSYLRALANGRSLSLSAACNVFSVLALIPTPMPRFLEFHITAEDLINKSDYPVVEASVSLARETFFLSFSFFLSFFFISSSSSLSRSHSRNENKNKTNNKIKSSTRKESPRRHPKPKQHPSQKRRPLVLSLSSLFSSFFLFLFSLPLLTQFSASSSPKAPIDSRGCSIGGISSNYTPGWCAPEQSLGKALTAARGRLFALDTSFAFYHSPFFPSFISSISSSISNRHYFHRFLTFLRAQIYGGLRIFILLYLLFSYSFTNVRRITVS